MYFKLFPPKVFKIGSIVSNFLALYKLNLIQG